MKALTVPLGPTVATMTLRVRVTGLRRYRVRAWVAARIVALAALVIGTRLDMTVDLDGPEGG